MVSRSIKMAIGSLLGEEGAGLRGISGVLRVAVRREANPVLLVLEGGSEIRGNSGMRETLVVLVGATLVNSSNTAASLTSVTSGLLSSG